MVFDFHHALAVRYRFAPRAEVAWVITHYYLS